MNKKNKKKKQKQSQRRQVRSGAIKRKRKKKALYLKHTNQKKKKPILKKVTDMKKVPLKAKIRFYIYKVIRKIRRLSCLIGIHDWKLCSGREGDSMFTCIKCWKGSKKKWGLGGSAKHYKEKEKGKMEVADPKNWKKDGKDYYFKGQYVKLSKEEIRRLEVVLGKRKDKKLGKIK